MISTTFPIPSTCGSLEKFIQTINNIPQLTLVQEQQLATRFREQNDLNAARQLVMSQLRVVVSIARDYAGYGLAQGDLIQEGSIGLMKAVNRFDPGRGVRLYSFAIHWIKAEIHEFILRNWRLVRVATTKPQRKLFFNLRSLKSSFAALSEQEVQCIADDLGVKPKDVREMDIRMNGHDVALLGETDNDNGAAPIDWLADSCSEPTHTLERRAAEYLRSEGLNHALSTLDARSRRIVEARWLGDDSGLTLHDLAAEFGVSAERIRQIEVKALRKMKMALTGSV